MKKYLKLILIFCLTIFGGIPKTLGDYQNSGNYQQREFAKYNDLKTFATKILPQKYVNGNFTPEDAKDLLYKKCKKAAQLSAAEGVESKNDAYERIESAANKLMECANDLGNVTQIITEMEVARPQGELDEVFEKYCNKLPQAQECLNEFNEQLLPCLTPAERAQNSIMMNIIKSLLSFVCLRNGNTLALFIAEEGPECFESNKENISNCMNATFSAYLPSANQTAPAELPELVIGPKQCIDLHDFEECVLSYLEKCNEITPANIIESLFRYVKNETKCQEEIDKVIKPSNMQIRNTGVHNNDAVGAVLYVIALFMTLRGIWSKYF